MRFIIKVISLTVSIAMLFSLSIYGIDEDLLGRKIKPEEPVIVKGDKVEYFRDKNKVVGSGNVSITYGDVELRCDKITVYTDTKEAICDGNVVITQPGAVMEGERIHYNFATKKGYAIKGRLKAKPWYGKADKIWKEKDRTFKIEKGYITTCDYEKPHYRIQSKEVKIYLDRKIVAKHVVFYIGSIPVFYLPIYVQPFIENKPHITVIPGRSSEWGYYALTAIRYYFNKDAKGHIRLDYREKKGLAEGLDYSYNAKRLGKGIVRVYYAHENDDLTLTKTGRKDDRWRVQLRHTMDLPEDTKATIELNKLSDEHIIKDYNYREFEENPDPDNYILVQTIKPSYAINFLVRKRFNTFFNVVERLPEFKLDIYNQRIGDTNFLYHGQNSLTNFIKRYKDTDNISPEKVLRVDTYHRFSYQAKLFRFLYFTPFVATRQTFYSINKFKEESQIRSLYEEGFSLSTKFYRIFEVYSNFWGLNINRLRHIITPTICYIHRQQPTISSANLYQFDSIDGIGYANSFEFTIVNKLQTKRPVEDRLLSYDLVIFIIKTNYTFRLKKRSLASQRIGRFGDFRFELEIRPYPWIALDSDWELDHKDYDVNKWNTDLYVDLGEKFTFGVGHRYEHTENDRTSLITGQMYYKINERWQLKTYQRYNITSQKWEEQEYTIFRDLHCWIAELTYQVKGEDSSSIWLILRLKAFPDIPIGVFKKTYRRTQPGPRRPLYYSYVPQSLLNRNR